MKQRKNGLIELKDRTVTIEIHFTFPKKLLLAPHFFLIKVTRAISQAYEEAVKQSESIGK